MTITLELPEELAARLSTVAGMQGTSLPDFAVAALAEAAERAEDDAADAADAAAWWDSLDEADQEAERQKTRASLAAADAGRSRPAAEVYERVRARK